MRPRYRGANARPTVPTQAAAQQNMMSAMSPVASALQQAIPGVTAKQPVTPVDFTTGAKAFKKTRRFDALLHAFALSVYILIAFAILVAVTGILVNKKYSGRALPMTYIGDLSVSGMSQSQIKAMLDEKVAAMQITFVDGGLTRTVPASKFATTVNTDVVSKQAIQDKFSPFAFLSKHRYEPTVTINQRQLAGYADLVLNVGKTPSEDAKIVANKNTFVVQPETQGFKTNPQLLAARITAGISTMNSPVIRLSSLNYKPHIYSSDLEDDVARANTMVNAAIAIEYGRTTIKPTLEQKMSWLQMIETPGSTTMNISFSKTFIRQYVLELAQKYQGEYVDIAKIKDTSKIDAITQEGNVINNIDEATDAIVSALSSGKALTQKLTTTTGTYNKLVNTQ